jgi:hypothetical protein
MHATEMGIFQIIRHAVRVRSSLTTTRRIFGQDQNAQRHR